VRSRPGVIHADASVDLTRLLDIVASFPRRTICVVGDFVLDQFVSGEISRISREAPVLILRHRRTEAYPGGAANAVNNLADLAAKVLPVGVVGDDNEGKILLDYFRGKRIDTSAILRTGERATTTKTRYLAGWTHTTEQQVLRVDREPREELPERIRKLLDRKARKAAKSADAVLVSDYGLGAASPEIVRKLNAKCMTLDSRYRLLDYGGTQITAATPNEAELEAAYHVTVGTDAQRLEELGRRTLRDLSLALYNKAAAHAETRGILLADTKFEFGKTAKGIILADEVLTPDSSRFWERASWKPGGPQPSFDKQFVRDYLESIHWNKQAPAPGLPDNVVERTQGKYLEAFRRLTGRTLTL